MVMGETQRMVGFDGLTVVAFESRMAEPMATLIARYGGRPVNAPSLREVPLSENHEALAFAERLLQGAFDVVILLTGVGTRTLVEAVATRYPRQAFLDALASATLVVRGPKPVAVLQQLGIRRLVAVPEPNTWREVLATLDREVLVRGKRVAVQEYGVPNWELVRGLEERGVEVTRVPVYRWALPDDTSPLREAVRMVAEGQVDVLLFTNAAQVESVLRVAGEEGVEEAFRSALDGVVVASIGPTCSEALKEQGIAVDLEPSHSKMAQLVKEAAECSGELLRVKRGAGDAAVRVDVVSRETPLGAACGGQRDDALQSSLLMKACRREPTEYTPVWIMRQAGRYMPEYRKVRRKVSLLQLCKTPELAAEVTVTAATRLGVDAAIIFSDLLLLVEAMGVEVVFTKEEGPAIRQPIRGAGDVERLRPRDPEEALGYALEAIRLTRASLPADMPLIGFVGAPFTLASYLIEGGSSRTFQRTKVMMYRHPGTWHALMERLATAAARYLNAQIVAGVQVAQLFDSWVGCLSPSDYQHYVLPHVQRLIGGVTPGVPLIHFGVDTGSLLELMRQAGGQVIGLDWRVELDQAWARLPGVGVQGNLDPMVLLAEPPMIREQARRILDQAGGRPGHIFNLGHGILPRTPVEHAIELVRAVHELSRGSSHAVS